MAPLPRVAPFLINFSATFPALLVNQVASVAAPAFPAILAACTASSPIPATGTLNLERSLLPIKADIINMLDPKRIGMFIAKLVLPAAFAYLSISAISSG